MDSIRRNSIVSVASTYAGFIVGAVNILILFPLYFSPEQIGLTRTLLDVALVLSTLCTLGSVPLTLKFHPLYRDHLPRRENDLPFLSLLPALTGAVLLLVLLPHAKPWILRKFGARSPLFVSHFDLVYPLTLGILFFTLFEAHAWSRRKAALSNALKELVMRLLTTLLILAFGTGLVGFGPFVGMYAWIYTVPLAWLVFALVRSGGFPIVPRFSRVTRRLWKRMASFSLFILAGALLNVVARTNDTIILASQSSGGLSDAAVFTIATYLVTVMDVPQRTLISTATPYISDAWKLRDLPRIGSLYHKTSLTLMITGIGIFSVVLLNIRDAERFLGPAYASLGMVVLVSGIGKLIDLSTGLNSQVLLLSKHWRLDFLTNLLLVALSIPLNYWLTRRFGLMGPAYGNLIALTVYNGTRFLMIWRLFRLQPFTRRHLAALAAGAACLAAVGLLPDTGNLYANVALRTLVFSLLFGWLIVRFRVSDDINGLFLSLRERLGW
jgi:O-antigen/teichoic acid export membrane protein